MLRRRGSHLGREGLAFSKPLAHHIGTLKLCICHYTLTRAAAESEHDMDITTPYLACLFRVSLYRTI